jgi:P27 family predicted phage terminase small subunit
MRVAAAHGRPRQPDALKAAKGERRPSRTNPERPELPPVPASDLDAPTGLLGAGLVEWVRIACVLSEAGVLQTSDLVVLENYCRTLTDLRMYERKAKRAGCELAIAKGYANQTIKLRTQVNILARELGLTPSSRSMLKVAPKQTEAGDEARFFGGPHAVGKRGA